MIQFTRANPETAPAAARPILEASAKRFGFLPSPVAHAAWSPALLSHLMASFAAFDRSSLSALEREVVAMTVAFENGCHYCMAMHSAMLADEGVRAALRGGTPLADARLEAIRTFARDLVRTAGRPPAGSLARLADAGIGQAGALDIVLGVGVYQLSTMTNVLTGAPVDPAFESFRWEKPAAAG